MNADERETRAGAAPEFELLCVIRDAPLEPPKSFSCRSYISWSTELRTTKHAKCTKAATGHTGNDFFETAEIAEDAKIETENACKRRLRCRDDFRAKRWRAKR